VFSICVSNTDDHLRNHGFILTENGWALSPAYEINPVESGDREIINQVKSSVKRWREIAKDHGISRAEQEQKAPAFRAAMA
jgi:serine/threonine-protein kinase HipA